MSPAILTQLDLCASHAGIGRDHTSVVQQADGQQEEITGQVLRQEILRILCRLACYTVTIDASAADALCNLAPAAW